MNKTISRSNNFIILDEIKKENKIENKGYQSEKELENELIKNLENLGYIDQILRIIMI